LAQIAKIKGNLFNFRRSEADLIEVARLFSLTALLPQQRSRVYNGNENLARKQ
jgi:hypothetical protein